MRTTTTQDVTKKRNTAKRARRGKGSYLRSSDGWAEGCGVVVAVLVLFAFFGAFGGWLTMLLVGVLYSENLLSGTLGFWTSVVVWALLSSILNLGPSRNPKEPKRNLLD
jgi:hypothetical protein